MESIFRERLGARRSSNGLRQNATATEDESVIGGSFPRSGRSWSGRTGELKDEAERIAEEARELAGELPF